MERVDVAVIGAGFGGLGAALSLAEGGAHVALYEALRYPGGCASTFIRGGYEYESGATLFAGFDEGQLFARWIDRHALPVETCRIDPIVEVRGPGTIVPVSDHRDRVVSTFCEMPGAPVDAIRRYFARQQLVADALWALFDDPTLLPPFDASTLFRHAARLGRYRHIAPLLGRPLGHLLETLGLADFEPLRLFLDCACQITVQTSAREAEAPFALAAVDYFFRGTRHVRGGIGRLAWAMARAVERLGGSLRSSDAVNRIERHDRGWKIHSRRGLLEARTVVANVLPQQVTMLYGAPIPALEPLTRDVEDGWSAAMLYLVIPAETPGVRPEAHHLELVGDASRPLSDGNHLFVSISGRDEPRGAASIEQGRVVRRTITISTHVRAKNLATMSPAEQALTIDAVHDAMRVTLARRAPEIASAVVHEMTASPRTFERFTRRRSGCVGGIPRRAGLHHYMRLAPLEPLPALFLVGDSAFPGQSTLATAIGGVKVAERILRRR